MEVAFCSRTLRIEGSNWKKKRKGKKGKYKTDKIKKKKGGKKKNNKYLFEKRGILPHTLTHSPSLHIPEEYDSRLRHEGLC